MRIVRIPIVFLSRFNVWHCTFWILLKKLKFQSGWFVHFYFSLSYIHTQTHSHSYFYSLSYCLTILGKIKIKSCFLNNLIPRFITTELFRDSLLLLRHLNTKQLFAELRAQSRELIPDLEESCVNVKVGRESERVILEMYLPAITAHLCGSGRTNGGQWRK